MNPNNQPVHVGVGKDEYQKGYYAGIEEAAKHMEQLNPHGIGRYLGVLIRKLKNE